MSDFTKPLALIGALLFLSGCVSIPRMLYATPATTPLSVTLKGGGVMRYMQYVPPQAKPGERLPLIVFLHGSGEAGGDTYSVLANGPMHYATQRPDFPFLILAPQLDRDGEWDPEALEQWLVQAEKDLPVDRRRVYLTGLSRGGQGTWDFAMRYPRRFAAIAPVAGYSDVNEPCRLKGLSVWAFHGDADDVVPIGPEQKLVDAAKACGVDVTYTVYEHSGHFVWDRTYNAPVLYDWLLQHKRPLIPLPRGTAPEDRAPGID